ncbi:hypothetical protein HPP92_013708 [Vanilla planifolia]|uniref:Uncharacterized protein n=1 Tax=Vanilla planifolia TaxID=51239 RepID=A0A835UWZ5_VANPL|nr:hypothetical protein HPP92_013708 [Vanilla planifolia]
MSMSMGEKPEDEISNGGSKSGCGSLLLQGTRESGNDKMLDGEVVDLIDVPVNVCETPDKMLKKAPELPHHLVFMDRAQLDVLE